MGLLMESNIAFHEGRLEEAREWIDRGLLAAPTNLFLRTNTAAIRLA